MGVELDGSSGGGEEQSEFVYILKEEPRMIPKFWLLQLRGWRKLTVIN